MKCVHNDLRHFTYIAKCNIKDGIRCAQDKQFWKKASIKERMFNKNASPHGVDEDLIQCLDKKQYKKIIQHLALMTT